MHISTLQVQCTSGNKIKPYWTKPELKSFSVFQTSLLTPFSIFSFFHTHHCPSHTSAESHILCTRSRLTCELNQSCRPETNQSCPLCKLLLFNLLNCPPAALGTAPQLQPYPPLPPSLSLSVFLISLFTSLCIASFFFVCIHYSPQPHPSLPLPPSLAARHKQFRSLVASLRKPSSFFHCCFICVDSIFFMGFNSAKLSPVFLHPSECVCVCESVFSVCNNRWSCQICRCWCECKYANKWAKVRLTGAFCASLPPLMGQYAVIFECTAPLNNQTIDEESAPTFPPDESGAANHKAINDQTVWTTWG